MPARTQDTRRIISTTEYELIFVNAVRGSGLFPRVGTIPLSERGIHSHRSENDPGYSETYSEFIVVVDDTANTTLEPIPLSGATTTFTVKNTNGGARQSGDFSDELNRQFRILDDPIVGRESKRDDWEQSKNRPSGTATHKAGPIVGSVEPGTAQVNFLRYWTLTQREERSVGEGRRKKTGWREVTMRGVFGTSVHYWPHTQRFVPEQAAVVNLPNLADPVAGRTFAALTLLKGERTPGGAANQRERITFGDGTFTRNHHGISGSGTYKIAERRVTLTPQNGATFSVKYDNVTGFLCNKEVTYHPAPTAAVP